jgi:hypothetical protein
VQYSSHHLETLIHELGRLPGIGKKTAQRLAFHLLRVPPEEALALARAITPGRSSGPGERAGSTVTVVASEDAEPSGPYQPASKWTKSRLGGCRGASENHSCLDRRAFAVGVCR